MPSVRSGGRGARVELVAPLGSNNAIIKHTAGSSTCKAHHFVTGR